MKLIKKIFETLHNTYTWVGNKHRKDKTPQILSKYSGDNLICKPYMIDMRIGENEWMKKQRKKLIDRTMTYIVSGKINNNPFLMVDCLVKNKINNINGFRNKLNELISVNEKTYYCITGNDAYRHSINIFDEKCRENNTVFDFKNENHIEEIIKIYDILSKRIEYNNSGCVVENYGRIYFINKHATYYYDIDNDGDIGSIIEIKNNTIIKPDCYNNTQVKFNKNFENTDELIKFCWAEIMKTQDENINLKNKYSFITFNDTGDLIVIFPYNNNIDRIFSYLTVDYSELI